jgi:hypothetical protein
MVSSRYSLAGIRAATTAPQEDLIARAVEVLRGDDRVLAAWLVGSFATGEADPWSDIDRWRPRSGVNGSGRRLLGDVTQRL